MNIIQIIINWNVVVKSLLWHTCLWHRCDIARRRNVLYDSKSVNPNDRFTPAKLHGQVKRWNICALFEPNMIIINISTARLEAIGSSRSPLSSKADSWGCLYFQINRSFPSRYSNSWYLRQSLVARHFNPSDFKRTRSKARLGSAVTDALIQLVSLPGTL